MSIMKRAMDFLGLGPDDSYEDYDNTHEPARRPQRDAPRSGRDQYDPDPEPARAAPSRPSFPMRDAELAPARRPAIPQDDSSVQPRPANPRSSSAAVNVRAASSGHSSEPATVKPRRFDQAQEIADRFKDGLPVIMNLESADREITRRLIDFASGLCYGLNGSMEKVASGVYLLKPYKGQPTYDES